jgi:glyoxylase-like metal-dependent hydrolase (beta-lactamase superfamily II)
VGDRVAREEHEKVGEDIPPAARRADCRVAEGEELVDGVRLRYQRLQGAETEDSLTIALPDAGVIIVQDLVYNGAHAFLGEKRFDSWRAALGATRALPYDVVLPGYGRPGGKALYGEMARYLDTAQGALASADGAAAFRARMVAQFPEYDGLKVLDHQLRFLFPDAAHA